MGKNEELGLPFGSMEKIAICFDVDGTLIDNRPDGQSLPNVSTSILLSAFAYQSWKNVDVIVWSARGADYAKEVVEEFWGEDLSKRVQYRSKHEWKDLKGEGYYEVIAIDDIQDTSIGDANLIVRNK